ETLFQTFRSDTPNKTLPERMFRRHFLCIDSFPDIAQVFLQPFPFQTKNKKAPAAADAPSFTGSPIF
ncbi:hypothetical protein, partial [Neisseria gonorrhoeae]